MNIEYRKVGMKTVKTYTPRTSMAWTPIIKMMINMRTFKELLNHMSQKKMMNKTFADAHRVSKHPHFPSLHPGSCPSDRGGTRRRRRRRTGTDPRRRTGTRRSRRRRMTS